MSLSNPLWTYSDMLTYLLDVAGAVSDARTDRIARQAILAAYRDLTKAHNWTCYYTPMRFATVAPYDTGTIAYDHTGGAVERLVTLTGGTAPEWIERAVLSIDGIYYEVDEEISSTEFTLSVNNNPGADIASGTSFTLYQDTYALPIDFRAGSRLRDADNGFWIDYVSPAEWNEAFNSRETTGIPRIYTFTSHPDFAAGQQAVRLYPPPSTARNYVSMMQRQPLPLRTADYSEGTVAVSGTTVTGTGTAWKSLMEGAVIRFGDANNAPDGIAGDNPFLEERIVSDVTGVTSLVIDEALDGTYSAGTKYRISDWLDINPQVMLTAFQAYAEREFSRMLRRDDYERLAAIARSELRLAMEADSPHIRDIDESHHDVYRKLSDLRHEVGNA